MLNRIWNCFFLVGRKITTLAGAASTAIGGTQHYFGVTTIPTWIWWLAAIVLMLATAVQVQWELMREKDTNRKPQPNMRLEDVVKRIRGKDDIFGPENSESGEVFKALTLIREHGAIGSLMIFGSKEIRYIKPEHHDLAVSRLPIPKEFWEANGFDYIAFLGNRHGITKPTQRPDDRSNEYEYIWLDKDQVDNVWPPIKSIEWRSPISFKAS
jgi:hypothetical protein